MFKFLKKKAKKEDKKIEREIEEKERKEKEIKQEVKQVKTSDLILSQFWPILKSPHITEKSTDLKQKNKYVFKVAAGANKIEIKKAIEKIYGVKVVGINIINVPPKPRKLGKSQGYKSAYRKAIVSLAEGQKIEET